MLLIFVVRAVVVYRGLFGPHLGTREGMEDEDWVDGKVVWGSITLYVGRS